MGLISLVLILPLFNITEDREEFRKLMESIDIPVAPITPVLLTSFSREERKQLKSLVFLYVIRAIVHPWR